MIILKYIPGCLYGCSECGICGIVWIDSYHDRIKYRMIFQLRENDKTSWAHAVYKK